MKYSPNEAKEWAKSHMKGLDSTFLPSFTPDTLELDEAGIRHDIRELIRHGFFGTTLVTEAGTTPDQDQQIIKWMVDEAKGRIGITLALRYYTIEKNIEMARFAEVVGCDSVMLCYPPNFHPQDYEEVYEYSRTICESTNIAVILFPSIKDNFPFPASIPAQWLNKMADFKNVVGMKIGTLEWAWIDECFRLFGDKICISYPFDDAWPILIRKYGMQWSGASPWQMFQTPDNPRQVRMFNLFQDGKMDDAMELYWQIDPVRKVVNQLGIASAMMGLYNFQQWKYGDELVGMAGGELPMPRLLLFTHQKMQLRQAMIACGMKIKE